MSISTVSCLTFFIALIPFTLLTGPFIPDLIVSISCLVFLIYSLGKSSIFEKYFNSSFFKIILIFWIYILVRSFFSSDIMLSLESSLFYIRFSLLALIIWFLLDNNHNFVKYFFLVACFSYSLALIDGYYQYFFDINLFGIFSPGLRMSLVMNDDLLMGSYLVRMFPLILAIGVYLYSDNKFFLPLTGIFFIFTDVLIYLTGERTSFFLLLISSIFIIFFLSKFKVFRLITLFCSLIIILFITLSDNQIKERNINTTINQMGLNKGVDELIFFTHIHHSHYMSALNMYKENKIFGHGPKSFRLLCSKKEFQYDESACSTHPHNTYFQLLAETGIVGLIFILIFILFLIKLLFYHAISSIRFKKKLLSDFELCLIACFLTALWPIMPTQSFFHNWINIIYYLPIGFFLFSFSNKKRDYK